MGEKTTQVKNKDDSRTKSPDSFDGIVKQMFSLKSKTISSPSVIQLGPTEIREWMEKKAKDWQIKLRSKSDVIDYLVKLFMKKRFDEACAIITEYNGIAENPKKEIKKKRYRVRPTKIKKKKVNN